MAFVCHKNGDVYFYVRIYRKSGNSHLDGDHGSSFPCSTDQACTDYVELETVMRITLLRILIMLTIIRVISFLRQGERCV